MAHATVDAFATFKERSFTPKNDHVTQTTPFRGIFYLAMRLAGQVSSQGKSLAVVDLLAKFKQCSSFIAEILMGFKILKMSRDLHHPNFEGKFLLLRWDLS